MVGGVRLGVAVGSTLGLAGKAGSTADCGRGGVSVSGGSGVVVAGGAGGNAVKSSMDTRDGVGLGPATAGAP